MGELLESLSEMSDALKGGFEAGSRELEGALSGLREQLEALGMNADALKVSEESGKLLVTNDGDPISLAESATKLRDFGDLKGSLRDLNAPEEFLSSPEFKTYSENYKTLWENQPGVKEIADIDESATTGKELEKKYGDPQTVDEVLVVVDKNPEVKKKLDVKVKELENKIKAREARGGKFEAGKWAKRGAVLAGGALVSVFLYKQILDHKKALNGCWMVDHATGQKCKISALTCDGASVADEINVCVDPKNCGTANKSDCFVVDSSCSGSCSETCNASTTKVPTGKTLKCVNVNFWGAAQDYLDSSLSDLLSGGWWWYIGLAVAAVVVAFILFR